MCNQRIERLIEKSVPPSKAFFNHSEWLNVSVCNTCHRRKMYDQTIHRYQCEMCDSRDLGVWNGRYLTLGKNKWWNIFEKRKRYWILEKEMKY